MTSNELNFQDVLLILYYYILMSLQLLLISFANASSEDGGRAFGPPSDVHLAARYEQHWGEQFFPLWLVYFFFSWWRCLKKPQKSWLLRLSYLRFPLPFLWWVGMLIMSHRRIHKDGTVLCANPCQNKPEKQCPWKMYCHPDICSLEGKK